MSKLKFVKAPKSNPYKIEANTSKPIHEVLESKKPRERTPLDKLFEDLHVDENHFGLHWVPISNIKLFKVFQDCPLQEMFKDLSGVYYATTKLLHSKFDNMTILYIKLGLTCTLKILMERSIAYLNGKKSKI